MVRVASLFGYMDWDKDEMYLYRHNEEHLMSCAAARSPLCCRHQSMLVSDEENPLFRSVLR